MRKKELRKLLESIRAGKFHKVLYENDLSNRHSGPTRKYLSPTELSGNNTARYMAIDEIGAGTPNIWRS